MSPPKRERPKNGLKVAKNEIEFQPVESDERLSFGDSRFGRRPASKQMVDGREFISVAAPRTFSLVQGIKATTDKSIDFLTELEWYLTRNYPVVVDFSGLRKITTDAILALWSLPVRCGENGELRLRLPRNSTLVAKMTALALYEIDSDDEFARPSTVSDGMMFMVEKNDEGCSITEFASGEDYDYEVIRDVIEFTSTKLLGQSVHFPNLKMLFDELKTNVMQHAAQNESVKERWFFSAYFDNSTPGGPVVRFNLLDHGVGILARIRQMWDRKFPNREFKWTTPEDVLSGVVRGEFRSLRFASSGEGLPIIPKMMERKMIGNVVILANNVIGRLSKNVYSCTNNEFSGSIIHWEANHEHAENLQSEA